MANIFLEKKYGANSSTALADDSTGTAKVKNLPKAAGIAYDSVDGFIKYNDAGNIRTLVNTNEAQTLTNKTLTSPVITGALATTAVETVAATNVIAASESGTTYFLSAATEFVSTLPAPAAGLEYEFIVAAAPSGADYTITTNASANILVGHVTSSDLNAAGDAALSATGFDTISFVSAKAIVGDRVRVISDGTNWFVSGSCSAFDAITFTTAS